MQRTFHLIPPAAAGRMVLVAVGVFLIGIAFWVLWMRQSLSALIILAGAFLVFYVAWSMRHVEIVVTPDTLRIRGDLFGKTIARSALRSAEAREISLPTDPAHVPVWRTCGTAVPGYLAGWFRLRNGEKALAFITDRSQVVYLPTASGFSVLLSVAQPTEFIQTLQERTNRKNNAG